jgi:hypothetical protein
MKLLDHYKVPKATNDSQRVLEESTKSMSGYRRNTMYQNCFIALFKLGSARLISALGDPHFNCVMPQSGAHKLINASF